MLLSQRCRKLQIETLAEYILFLKETGQLVVFLLNNKYYNNYTPYPLRLQSISDLAFLTGKLCQLSSLFNQLNGSALC